MALFLIAGLLVIGTVLPAAALDRTRYIGADEIKAGMQGYGLTVFRGTRPEKFPVEVISVSPGGSMIGARRKAILIKCYDERFDLAKGVQGVSGSPVYFDGRLAGAMSFGWPFSEEPLYGVTPIEYMLETRVTGKAQAEAAGNRRTALDLKYYQNLMGEDLLPSAAIRDLLTRSGMLLSESRGDSCTPLPVAMTVGGLSRDSLEMLREWLPGMAIHAAAGGGGGKAAVEEEAVMQPGGVLTIPIVMGDINASVLGTITEVVGDQVYAFGHEWNGVGMAEWPMAPGFVHTFVNSKQMSFKLGYAFEPVGTVRADEMTAIYGETGSVPPMTPVHIEVDWDYIDTRDSFEMQMARDPVLAPLIGASVVGSCLMQRGGLPLEHAIEYEIRMSFEGIPDLHFTNFTSAGRLGDISMDIMPTLMLVLDNPWEKITFREMSVKATIFSENRLCAIKNARIDRPVYRPGESVQIAAEFEADRSSSFNKTLSLQLPDDISEGRYTVVLGSFYVLNQMRNMANPMRYRAQDMQDVHRILQQRLSNRRDRLYAAMILQDGGLALADSEMPELPVSKAMVLMDATRKTPASVYKKILVTDIPLNHTFYDKVEFEITVEK